jgi:hypothetical protein
MFGARFFGGSFFGRRYFGGGGFLPPDTGGGDSMTKVRLSSVKRYLRVTHRADDYLLQDLIGQAEAEVLSYLDREELPRRGEHVVNECDSNSPTPISDSDDLAEDVRGGIYLLVQGMYEGKDADEMTAIRAVVIQKVHPYRNKLGV